MNNSFITVTPPSPSRSIPGTPAILFSFVCAVALAGCARTAEYSSYTQSLIQRVETIRAQRGELRLTDEERKELHAGPDNRVRGSVQVEATVDTAALDELGISVESRLGTVWTLNIPLETLEKLGAVRGIRYIEIPPPVRQRLAPGTP